MTDVNSDVPYGVAAAAGAGAAAGSIAAAAGAAETVVQNVMRVEPMIAGIAGMFVPGLAMVQPWIVLIAPYLEKGLDDLSKGNNGDALAGLLQLIQHISKNGPNSPILTPPGQTAMNPASNTYSPVAGPSQDASAQGSG